MTHDLAVGIVIAIALIPFSPPVFRFVWSKLESWWIRGTLPSQVNRPRSSYLNAKTKVEVISLEIDGVTYYALRLTNAPSLLTPAVMYLDLTSPQFCWARENSYFPSCLTRNVKKVQRQLDLLRAQDAIVEKVIP